MLKTTMTAKIFEREKSGRGFKYLVSLYVILSFLFITYLCSNNSDPKWVNRFGIPKKFYILVEEFDRTWDEALVLAKKTKQNNEDYYDGEEYNDEDVSYDDKNDYFSDDEFLED